MPKVPILDYAMLAFDTDESPKHVAGLQYFRLPKGASRNFVRQLVGRIKAIEPTQPFNQKLEQPLLRMPEWVAVPDLDLDDHVFHESVPAPYTEDALLERIEVLHAEPLNRSGPLWELYFFEHLSKDRFAVYFKVHHAYMDGISLSRRAMASLSENRTQKSVSAFWGATDNGRKRESAGIDIAQSLKKMADTAQAVPALAKLGLKHGLRLAGLGGGELPVPFTAPRTAFNNPLTPQRSVAVADIPLKRVKNVAHFADVTVNDVILELCDKAMTQYLEDHGGAPDRPLIAQMPISLRREGSQQGNQITIALLELGSRASNPVRRLQDIHAHANDVKREFSDMTPETAEAYTLLTQSVAQFGELLGLNGVIPPLGNTIFSNVIGPGKRLYLAGAELLATYPISAIAPGTAMNITIYTYVDTLHMGIVAGRRAVPELRPLANYLQNALEELEQAMGLTSSPAKTRRKSSAKAQSARTKPKKKRPRRVAKAAGTKSRAKKSSARNKRHRT